MKDALAMPLAEQAPPKAVCTPERPGRLARWALAAGSLCLTFAAAEIAMRAGGCQPRTATVLSTYFQPDAVLGWRGRPGAVCRFVTSSFDVEITHGPDGFRACPGGKPARDADTAAEIVWCLGDSYVWGWGVADGETFVDVLNRDSAPGRAFRNLGVSGFGTVQEYLLLGEMLAKEPAPDQVLLVFCENDLADNVEKGRPRFVWEEDRFVIEGAPAPSWMRQCGSWLKRHSLAFNYLNFYYTAAKNLLATSLETRGPSRGEPTTEGAGCPRQAQSWTDSLQWRALHHAYRRMRDLCELHHVRLSVVWQSEEPAPPRLAAVTEDLSIRLLDLSGPLRKQREAAHFDGPLRFRFEEHYTARGHAMVAKAIESQLSAPAVARRLSPARPGPP
jgi:hypothetical protein